MSIEGFTATSATEPDAMMKRIFKVAEIIQRTHQYGEPDCRLSKKGAEKSEDREIKYREIEAQPLYS